MSATDILNLFSQNHMQERSCFYVYTAVWLGDSHENTSIKTLLHLASFSFRLIIMQPLLLRLTVDFSLVYCVLHVILIWHWRYPAKTPGTHQKQNPTLVHYLDNTVADGWRQSGSVQSPQSGVLTIPTLPCGLWCHTGLCLWMAICSSPLISNRWWETSKWWSFTKTSSQNKVKGTQKNTKWSHEKRLYVLNCCRLCCRQQ